MFENLRKKFSSFIDSVTKKEEEKDGRPQDQVQQPALQQQPHSGIPKAPELQAQAFMNDGGPTHAAGDAEKQEPADSGEKSERQASEHHQQLSEEKTFSSAERTVQKPDEAEGQQASMQHAGGIQEGANREVQQEEDDEEANEAMAEISPHPRIRSNSVEKDVERYFDGGAGTTAIKTETRQSPKVSFMTRLKGVIFHEVTISEKDVDGLLDEFRMALLQSDVNYDVAERLVCDMKKGLVGSRVESSNISSGITSIVRNSMMSILSRNAGADILSEARKRKKNGETPFKVLFIGPNGAGKTTTIGKIANMMLENGLTCVLSASDTFRAAAIEQTSYHAQRLGINVVKGEYGADPSSIAFDAIAFAKARGIDVVLIDSAGRQETNKNLLEEVKKMVRVAKPDMKIFVGEAITGNSLLGQVKAFDEAVKLDGIVLTKLDVDSKGGNTISILSDTTIPVLFFGTGEAYSKLIPYDPKMIIDSIIPQNN